MDLWDTLTLFGVALILIAAYLIFGWPGVLALGGAALVGVGLWGAGRGK